MAAICELSDLPVDQCACRIHKPVEPPADYDVAVWFPARFDSGLDCGHEAFEGDTIGRTHDGEYVCSGCGDIDHRRQP